ncbi:MAG: O-antigen ligase family protein [Actinomycetota bacterium]|nr:O-antigen ligase family protein [Actinomycetota bacterium]
MATVELSRPGVAEAGRDVERGWGGPPPGPEIAPSRAPSALIVALLLLVLYAAFAHGAQSDPAEARVQIALSLVAALAGIGWLWSGTLRVGGRSLALAGAALLGAFAVWNGITLLWSVAPNQTWLELNRDLAYVIVLALAVGVGASHPRPLRATATGYLVVALVVTVYALGQKVVPGLHIGGLFDLNQTATFARLQSPLDYWNALALFVAFAVPIALVIAVSRERSRRVRIASLLGVELMLIVIGLTYSRGGLIVLVVAVGVSLAFGGTWLRSLVLLGAAVVASATPLWMALSVHSLSAANVSLGDREVGGAEFAGVLLVTLVGLYAAGHRLLDHDARITLTPERGRRLVRLLLAGVGVAVVALLVAAALSSRGLGGSISHAWQTFTTPHATANVNTPNLSVSSGNRWVWWKEAVGSWSDRPFGGWGAGSFQVVDRMYSPISNLSVEDAHSVPLQWLAETGLVGGLLAIGGYGLLLAGGVEATRRKTGAERAFAAALLAAGAAYAIHAFYDWDWDIPGVTFPVMVFLGVLAGSGIAPSAWRGWRQPLGLRGATLALCTFILCVYALSALLPSLAATKASAALTRAGATSSRVQRENAQATAELAARLNPLSDEGLRAAASISLSVGLPAETRSYLLQAVGRDPSDELAWEQLADLELQLRDVRAMRQAVVRILALDPRGADPHSRQLALELQQLSTPPNDSATATGTPLPVG